MDNNVTHHDQKYYYTLAAEAMYALYKHCISNVRSCTYALYKQYNVYVPPTPRPCGSNVKWPGYTHI